MVAQDELRRRIRAAMALHGISSWEELAAITPFSRSLLKDIGTPRAVAGEHHLRPIAAACGVPYAWFTVPDLAAAVAGADDASLAERVEALERRNQAARAREVDYVVSLPDGQSLIAEVKAAAGSGKTAQAIEQVMAYTLARLEHLESVIDTQGREPADRVRDATRVAIDASRAVKEVASVSAGVDRGEREPAVPVRDEGDASRGSARVASSRTPGGRR